MGNLTVEQISVGLLDTNCYILMDEDVTEGYIIDPGGQAGRIVQHAESLKLKCLGILCTHGHFDHIGAVGKVAELLEAPVMISKNDAGYLDGSMKRIGIKMSSFIARNPSSIDRVGGGDEVAFGDYRARVLDTPGHTPGSISFLCENNLFCGDLIFKGSVGRTDLKGSSTEDLLESIRREVLSLPDDYRIWPGHGPATTVGKERRSNPYLENL
ncbi:MAG: MBL fold metallo-hydrolase [Actinobacteria bacterium]|nr:MBL fold metallo-hydrolase [Actinomycetota bacterium]